MKRFRIQFVGRKVGAIGIVYRHDVTVEAETPEDAVAKLYDTHEHITGLEIAEVPDCPMCID